MQSWSYAILSQTLQVTLHRKYSGNAGNVVWTTSGHFLYICIYQVLHVKKYKVILSLQGHREGTSSVALEVLIIICQIYFINLFIFNCLKLNIKIVHLQVVWCQIFVFRKSCLSYIEENGCLGTYGGASLVLDFELTQEKDDRLSSRHK